MFDTNNAPVTAHELANFAVEVAAEIDIQALDPRNVPLVLAMDDGDRVLMFSSRDPQHPSTLSQIGQLLASRRRMIAMAGCTGWSPADDVPVSAAWVLVTVGRGGGAAYVLVRRIAEDVKWTRTLPAHLPWFALSTAASLRATLEGRPGPLRLKRATAALYRRPDECPDPPVDERGAL